ncbi:hypothetical protein HY948_03710, partial [Candidatus Gottesmanbacteria bacterium]|nr:hypothetical protein [Candidatus Gottesmanbacteria bacterium]
IDDGKIDTDRNVTAKVTNFIPGHMIYSHMPVGAYVSRDWLMQQLQASSQITDATKSYTNCGALGCSETIIKLFDVDTHLYQMFSVKADDLMKWVLVEHN